MGSTVPDVPLLFLVVLGVCGGLVICARKVLPPSLMKSLHHFHFRLRRYRYLRH